MPVPQQLGRGAVMGRGPYEKSGLLEDSSLPPLRPVSFHYDVFFPLTEEEIDDRTVQRFPSKTLDLSVTLTYQPFGTADDDAVVWRDVRRTVTLPTGIR
jgi:hypothetical protein